MLAPLLHTSTDVASLRAIRIPSWDASNAARAGRSILVVDDHQPTVDSIVSSLEPSLYRVEHSSTGARATALIHDRAFDVVLVSLALPDNKGFRLLLELKQASDSAVVALVGGQDFFRLNYQLRIATAVGVNGMIVRPISAQRLQVVLDQVLRRSERTGSVRSGTGFRAHV